MSTCLRYYLAADGTLCAVEEPGHCSWYWTLYTRWLDLANAVAPTIDREAELREQAAEAQRAIQYHVEVCETCRAWLDRCEQIAGQQPEPVQIGAPLPTQQPVFTN